MTGILSESRPRSRGRVRCDLCGQRIPRGVQYTQTTYAEYGEIWDWRECGPCQDVARYVQRWWDEEETYGLDHANSWASETCLGEATTRHELLTALRYLWRYWNGKPGRVLISRATLRKCFKPERNPIVPRP